MNFLRSTLILVLAVSFAACGGPKKETPQPVEDTAADSLKVAAGSYRNDALSYSITYPKDLLTMQESTDPAGEQVFAPAEGPARLRIYSDKRIDKKTGKELTFNEAFEQDAAETKGRQVIQRSLNPTNYIIAGVENDKVIFYQKTLMKNNSLVTAKLTYTKEEKKAFDAIIASMFGSFK